MGKIILNYKFNNPNLVDSTADMLFKLFVESNKPMVDETIKNKLNELSESHSA